MAGKIYTRTGDTGDTGLFGGGRVPKDHPRVDAYGTVDELNASLGWARTQIDDTWIGERLETVQHDLFVLGADLATPPSEEGRPEPSTPVLPLARVEAMEAWIDEADTELPELRVFVLPGGTEGAAALHLARTVCRRAERAVTYLTHSEHVSQGVVPYLNRLSDLLFALARLANHRAGAGDVEWRKTEE
jgi:cob(I)alamin adenosyltransferase